MNIISAILIEIALVCADLIASSHDSMEHGAPVQRDSKNKIELKVLKVSGANKKVVQIKLTINNQPITLNDLKTVHTQKIHLLIIDDQLQDYAHVHPKGAPMAGVYEFKWTPANKTGHYRIWADLLPNGQPQALVMADLTKGPKRAIERKVEMVSVRGGLTFRLSFDNGKIQSGKPAMGNIIVTDAKGNLVKNLEPVMGAFAHIVAFSEDFKSVIHIHPMGDEPDKSAKRGGPELQFHIEPKKPGFIKMFAQFVVNGKELFVPFGFDVQ